MTFEEKFVISKLNKLKGYISELRDLVKLKDKEILEDPYKFHTAERLLQLIVDTMLDINQHFIRELNLKIGEDFQSTFYTLGENNILPNKFAQELAPVVGLRNLIVHRYEELNQDLFITNLKKNFSDFKNYIEFIKKYLKKIK